MHLYVFLFLTRAKTVTSDIIGLLMLTPAPPAQPPPQKKKKKLHLLTVKEQVQIQTPAEASVTHLHLMCTVA